ncbi:MAG: hypothetical protein ACR5KV_03155 [Wolbachia sp.]
MEYKIAIWNEIKKTRTKHTQCCTEFIEWRSQGSIRRSCGMTEHVQNMGMFKKCVKPNF